MSLESIYRIYGVSRLDKIKLENQTGISFEYEPIPDDTLGEPATFVMIATLSGIATVAAYLLKSRKRTNAFVEIEECRPDGTKIKKRIVVQEIEEYAGKEIAEIVKQITGR